MSSIQSVCRQAIDLISKQERKRERKQERECEQKPKEKRTGNENEIELNTAHDSYDYNTKCVKEMKMQNLFIILIALAVC